MNPEALSFSTSYNAFKNNDYQPTSIVVSGTVTASGLGSFTQTISLAREDSVAQIYISTNRASASNLFVTGEWYALPLKMDYTNGSTPTLPGTASYSALFYPQFTGNQLVMNVQVPNPYPETLSNISATYDFKIFTFVAPFAS